MKYSLIILPLLECANTQSASISETKPSAKNLSSCSALVFELKPAPASCHKCPLKTNDRLDTIYNEIVKIQGFPM